MACAHPDITARLERSLLEWVESSPARVPERNPQQEPFEDLAGYFLGGQIATPPSYEPG